MNKKQVSINIIINLVAYGATIFITFYLTPYIINNLGVEAYGFFPLANTIISYTTLITVALNSMAQRFISISYHKNDMKKVLGYFNTVLFTNIIVAVVLFLFGSVATIVLNQFLDIPSNMVRDVKLMFFLLYSSSMLVLALSVYRTSTFIKNRLDVNAYINLLKPIIRGGILLLLFSLFSPSLIILGLSSFVVFSFEAFIYIKVKNKLVPNIKVSFKYYSKSMLYELAKSGSWNILSRINSILIIGLDLLLANIFLGPIAAGVLALSKNIPSYTNSLTNIISSSFNPSLTQAYALDEDSLMQNLKKSFVPLYLFGSIILGGIISVSDLFYAIWIPAQNSSVLYLLTILTLSYTFSSYGFSSFNLIYIIKNRLKVYTLVNLASAILSCALVIILLKTTDLGLFAIAGVSSALSIFKQLSFIYWYNAKLLKQKWYIFYLYSLKSLLCLGIVVGIGYIVRRIIYIDSWGTFGVAVAIIAIVSFIINLFIATKKHQRKLLLHKASIYFKNRKR